jgi:hypothetical protein
VVEWLGVSAAARHLLLLLGDWPVAASVLGQCRVGLRGTAVEHGERAVDAEFKVPAALAGRVVGVCPRDAHDDLPVVSVGFSVRKVY